MRLATQRRVLRAARALGPFTTVEGYCDHVYPDAETGRVRAGVATSFSFLMREGLMQRVESNGETFWSVTPAGHSRADEPDLPSVVLDNPFTSHRQEPLPAQPPQPWPQSQQYGSQAPYAPPPPPQGWHTWTDPSTGCAWMTECTHTRYWAGMPWGWVAAVAPAHAQWSPCAPPTPETWTTRAA